VAEDAPLLVVKDTLDALTALAAEARARTTARVIAVTGSVGKTSTKDMLATMLRGQGAVHAAERSFNNHWGVPLTLARMPAATDFAIIEIGMNHAGEIAPLSRLTRPDAAVITTVEAVHLEHFDGIEGIADAKAEIFAGLSPEGTAVLYRDNPLFDRLAGQAASVRVLTFGSDPSADIGLGDIMLSEGATVVSGRIADRPVLFKIAAPGRHMALNATAALACLVAIGADAARGLMALAQWSPPGGRGARHRVVLGPGGLDGEIVLIDDSYNANPASVRAALAVLAASPVTDGIGRVTRGRRIAFLGDMLELGPTEGALHAGLASLAEMAAIDVVHCCGPRMRALYDALPPERRGHWTPDSAALAEKARRLVDAGDVCMVKGSKGSRMGPVIEAILALGIRPDQAEGL
jgi:UDP-N-acetylmuramoyl-tripeptide--D-alanyl-D-alanine ligase